jgi:O-antigen/teichoic acid export membrane protein
MFQWLRLSMVRFLPACKDDPVRLKSALLTSSVLMLLALLPFALIAYFLPFARQWRPVIFPCWVILALQSMFELCNEYSRAILRPWQYMGLQVARSGSILLLGMAMVKLGAGWASPLIGMGVGMAAGVAYAYRRDWLDARLTIDRALLIKLCQYGIPLSLTVALTVVISSSDRFLIASFKGDAAAGLYSVAVDFTSQTLTLLMLVINLAMFPIAVRAWENHGRQAAQDAMKSNASLLMAVGMPCVVGLTVIAPGIAHCFLGKDYRQAAAGIIPLIALGSFVAGLKAYHFDAAFQFVHRTIYQVWIVLFAAVVNIGLNLIAIPHWGINGAAVASLLAFVISIALTAGLGRRHFALPFPLAACLQVGLASAAMAAVLFPFRDHVGPLAVALQIAGGAAVYGGVLLGVNFLHLREPLLKRLGIIGITEETPGRPDIGESISPRPSSINAEALIEV